MMQSQSEVKALKGLQGVIGCWDLLRGRRSWSRTSQVTGTAKVYACRERAVGLPPSACLLPFDASNPADWCCSDSKRVSLSSLITSKVFLVMPFQKNQEMGFPNFSGISNSNQITTKDNHDSSW